MKPPGTPVFFSSCRSMRSCPTLNELQLLTLFTRNPSAWYSRMYFASNSTRVGSPRLV